MTTATFTDLVDSEEALRELMGYPSELAVNKQLTTLDHYCRAFIALSPFLLIGTTDAAGRLDVSPRGDAAGSVLVLDERTLAIAERPGNKRADTLRNIIQTGSVGLLFLIPGVEDVLRVNGRASLSRNLALLERLAAQGKQPLLAIGVEVEECFMHCAKACKRSRLWQPAHWPDHSALPSLGRMLLEQTRPANKTLDEIEAIIEDSYTNRLY